MLNHWFSPENSTDPESDRGPTGASTPHNLVTSVMWNVPGSGGCLGGWRLSTVTHSQSGSPYTIRYAGDPVGYGSGVGAACNSRGCQPSTPERTQHRARHVHQLRRPHDGETVRRSRTGSHRVPRRRVQHVQQPEPARGRLHQPGWQPAVRAALGRIERSCPAASSSSRSRIASSDPKTGETVKIVVASF